LYKLVMKILMRGKARTAENCRRAPFTLVSKGDGLRRLDLTSLLEKIDPFDESLACYPKFRPWLFVDELFLQM